ncbi:MAG: FCD domain-containing protein [Tissierellia bacterium]|jgi:DNA-binding FadR family transcriptional regulator|nr:FCD domain-containing protein [Tissierellia bacterium]
MHKKLQDKEIAVLESLEVSKGPMGSWNLVEKLEEKGYYISSATIGRILNTLEKRGYAQKYGNNGRIITQEGLDALSNSKIKNHISEQTQTLEQMISTTVLDDYIIVLQARKAIERETARLAAENITKEELTNIRKILDEQRERHKKGESVAECDIAFHRAIAKASRNKVLETLYMMLFSYGQQTTIFEHVRRQVNAVYMTSHTDIYEALKKHDAELAEKCMIGHMDSLIEDVTKYWDLFY